MMKDINNVEGDVAALQLLDYPLLPCSPSSPKWKGSIKLRAILSKMLIRAGYGRQGTKKNLGVGIPPIGWPQQQIPWENFKGASRSKLIVNDITVIIVSMMRGANLDPETHIVAQPDEVENIDMIEEIEDVGDQNIEYNMDNMKK